MGKGVYEFLEYVGQSLIQNVALTTFCNANFSKSLSVFIGQDEAFLPTENQAPCAIITAGGRGLSGDSHIKNRSARITLCIKDSDSNRPAAIASGVVTYPGLGLLDEFENLVTDALDGLANHPSGYYISETSDGPDDVIQFPVYKAFLGLSIQLDSDY